MEKREDRKAREEQQRFCRTEQQRKSASLTQPPKHPNKEEKNPSFVLPPGSPSGTAEAEGILEAKSAE